MAIRGPGGQRPDAGPTREGGAPIRDQAASPIQRLMDFGMAKTPQEAQKVLKEIVALLAGAGFPVPKTGTPEQQLPSTLRNFQLQMGLPATGKLDEATTKALGDRGLLPGTDAKDAGPVGTPAGKAGQGDVVEGPPRPGFNFGQPRFADGGAPRSDVPLQKGRNIETEQAASRVSASRPDVEVDLKSMLNTLRAAGFAGAGKGKEQLQDAVKKLQRVDGLPVTGKIDAKTAESLERRGVLDAVTAQVLKEQDPSYAPPTSSAGPDAKNDAKNDAKADVKADASARGDDAKGAGGDVGSSAGRGSDGGDGVGHDPGSGVVAHGDDGGESDSVGNNYAGDLDDDDARGHATVHDDDADDAAAHYEVKGLRDQIDAAFDAIVRDDDKSGAATYSWALVLHRPGIYGRRQPAEELLKLSVSAAGPFDPVWQEAIRALNDRLLRADEDAELIPPARIGAALQQARYRTRAPDETVG